MPTPKPSKVYTGTVPIAEHLETLATLYNHKPRENAAHTGCEAVTPDKPKNAPHEPPRTQPERTQCIEIQMLKKSAGLE